MITVITEKPMRSIEIKGYGVDSYMDRNDNRIYRVYGVVKSGGRGRLVSRDSEVIKDLYIDDSTIVIFRSDKKEECITCKNMIDAHVARGIPVFAVEEFKEWLKNPVPPTKEEVVNADEN